MARRPTGPRQVFTPAQAAAVCGLSGASIRRAFDKGLLKGWKVPGGKYRRIERADLEAFVAEYGLTADWTEGRGDRQPEPEPQGAAG